MSPISGVHPWAVNRTASTATVTKTVEGRRRAPIALLVLPDLLTHAYDSWENSVRARLKRVREASVAWNPLISLMPSSISTVAADSAVWAAPKRSVMPETPDKVRDMTPSASSHSPTSAHASRQSVHSR